MCFVARCIALVALIVSLAATATISFADEARKKGDETVSQQWVEEALQAAGENRSTLEGVLSHFRDKGDPRMLVAARFLIANMPGHGHIVTTLRDKDKNEIAFDPLAYTDFKAARHALEVLEKRHGELEFDRAKKVLDVEIIKADYLIAHIEAAFRAWRGSAESRRVDFETFCNFVLPYRGSQEPLNAWLQPLMMRYAALEDEVKKTPPSEKQNGRSFKYRMWKRIGRDVHQRVRFNERYYLHPTDQGFDEMESSGQGRCEDITNMTTFAARAVALATAADYTPAWGHRDNNHAWNVLLDRRGRGSSKGNAHAAKVYRKTFAVQRDNLIFQLSDKSLAPSRFMASPTYVDVTDQYAPTTDVTLPVEDAEHVARRFAFLCVFNGGDWTPIHWGEIKDGSVTFDKMGRNICYLPATYDGETLLPISAPFTIHRNGTVATRGASGSTGSVFLQGTHPKFVSPDTHEVTPKSTLKKGTTYTLHVWRNHKWQDVRTFVAGDGVVHERDVAIDGLYWLVAKGSRRLERIFTMHEGTQRWW